MMKPTSFASRTHSLNRPAALLACALAAAALGTLPLAAGDPPPGSWASLDQRSKELAAAVQERDSHAVHHLAEAVSDEASQLQQAPSALPHDRQRKVTVLLVDIGKQAARIHHDSHEGNWDDAAAAQKQFASDLAEAEGIAVPAGH